MMIGKDAMARAVRVRLGALGNDGGVDLEARKRRVLKRASVLAAAAPQTHDALCEAGTIQRIAKGRVVMSQGDAAATVGFVGIGRVRMVRGTHDGRTLALGYRGAGDMLGEAGLGGATTYRDSVLAIEDVELLGVPLSQFRALCAADPALGAAVWKVLVDRQYDTEERLASMLFRNVEARLAEFLLKAAERWGIPDPRGTMISAPFTHQEMSAMIGSTRETVTLTLGDFRRKGIVDVDRRRVILLDVEALRGRA